MVAETKTRGRGGLRWRRHLVVALLLVVAGSIAARVSMARDKPETAPLTAEVEHPHPGGVANAVLPGQPQPGEAPQPQAEPAQQPGGAESLLPFVTEGGIAMLLGIALGVATRAIAKLALFFVALVFVVIQFLAVKGALTVDWQAVEKYVFNIPVQTGLSEVVKYKLPSAGSLLLGFYLGLKRG